jgi:hypothetical protein
MNKREERLRRLAEGAQNRVSSQLGDIWWAFMLRGVFAGVLGICALIWPTLGFTILTRLVGLYLLADGLPGLMGALRAAVPAPNPMTMRLTVLPAPLPSIETMYPRITPSPTCSDEPGPASMAGKPIACISLTNSWAIIAPICARLPSPQAWAAHLGCRLVRPATNQSAYRRMSLRSRTRRSDPDARAHARSSVFAE